MVAKVVYALASTAALALGGWSANTGGQLTAPVAVAWAAQSPEQGAAQCSALARVSLPDTEVLSATVQSANTPVFGASYTAADKSKIGAEISGLPAFCRVAGRIHPEPGSDIRFEVWLPLEQWNGRYMGVGNGGFAGSIRYKELGETVKAGYATASTDTGHDEKVTPLASFAPGNPAKLRDYGWRAVHLTTVNAKRLVAAFYGKPAHKAYFQSCSNGGRQGLMAASRFPQDFDGILAGAPAVPMTQAVMSQIWSQQVQSRPGAAFRPEQMKFLQDEVLRQCDPRDGLKDGLIDDPRMCRIDVSKLACGASTSAQCFSAAQTTALRQFYDGPPRSNGRPIAFPFSPSGAEAGRPVPFLGWDGFIAAGGKVPPQQTVLAQGTIQQLQSPPLGTIEAFDWRTDPQKLVAGVGRMIDVQPNLTRYFARGGKLIIYHGWADAAVPPLQTIAFYGAMMQQSGAQAARSSRLFMIPGMQHCFGGTGAELFGEMSAPAGNARAEDNISAALQQWVETGRKPDQVIGTMSSARGEPAAASAKQRLHCAYPRRAALAKGADPDKASSYSCK